MESGKDRRGYTILHKDASDLSWYTMRLVGIQKPTSLELFEGG